MNTPSDDKNKYCHDCQWFNAASEYCLRETYRTLSYGKEYFDSWAIARGDPNKCGLSGRWWETKV